MHGYLSILPQSSEVLETLKYAYVIIVSGKYLKITSYI